MINEQQQEGKVKREKMFLYVNSRECYRPVSIQRIGPSDWSFQSNGQFFIHSYNVTFPQQRMVRVNLIELSPSRQYQSLLSSQLESQFTNTNNNNNTQDTHLTYKQQQSPRLNKNSLITYYCQHNNGNGKTVIRKLHHNIAIDNVIQQIASYKLTQQLSLSTSSSSYNLQQQFLYGFDALLIKNYLIYGDKCHLPLELFLKQAASKGYPFVKVSNEIKYIFQELTHHNVVVAVQGRGGLQLSKENNNNFWNINNFSYDINKDKIIINFNQNNKNNSFYRPTVIKQNTGQFSPLIQISKQQVEKLIKSKKYLSYVLQGGSQVMLIDYNKISGEVQQQYSDLNNQKETKYINFYEQQRKKCRDLISSINSKYFQPRSNSKTQMPSSLTQITTTNSKFRHIPSSQNSFHQQKTFINNSQFKDSLKHIQEFYCQNHHTKFSQIPHLLLELIKKAKLIGLALASKSYSEFINQYRRLRPKHPAFNPAVIYFQQLKLSQPQIIHNQQESHTFYTLYKPHIQQMRQLTQLLITRYQGECKKGQLQSVLNHQKKILTLKLNCSCQRDALIQTIEFKIQSISPSLTRSATSASTVMRQKSLRKKEQSLVFSANNNNRQGSSSPTKPALNKINRQTDNVLFQKQQKMKQQHSSSGQLYDYENLPLWEQLSLERNYNNLEYGLDSNLLKSISSQQQNTTSKHSLPPNYSSNKNIHFNLQILKRQLQNQITHNKALIEHVQSQMILAAVRQGNTTTSFNLDEFVSQTIIWNLLILQFTAKVYFYSSILSRSPPQYNFTLSLYHINKAITITTTAITTIQQLKSNSPSNLMNNLNEFSFIFRQNLIFFLYHKINLSMQYMASISISTLEKQLQQLQMKAGQFYGKYHSWNIFVQLLKLKLVKIKYQQHPKDPQYQQSTLQIYIRLKQIQYSNGQQANLDFIIAYPRISKQLHSIEREFHKLSNSDDSQTILYIQENLQKFINLNQLYFYGLYRYCAATQSKPQEQTLNHSNWGYNEPVNQLNKSYRGGSVSLSSSSIGKTFNNVNSFDLRQLQNQAFVSIYSQQQRFYSQLRQCYYQTIKQLSQTGMYRLTEQVIEMKMMKIKSLMRQHPLFTKIQGWVLEKNQRGQQILISKSFHNISRFQQQLLVAYLMVNLTLTIYTTTISIARSPASLMQLKQSISQYLQITQHLSTSMLCDLAKQTIWELQFVCLILSVKYLGLLSLQQLREQSQSSYPQQVIDTVLTMMHTIRTRFNRGCYCHSRQTMDDFLSALSKQQLYLNLLLSNKQKIIAYYDRQMKSDDNGYTQMLNRYSNFKMLPNTTNKKQDLKKNNIITIKLQPKSLTRYGIIKYLTQVINCPSQSISKLKQELRLSSAHLIIMSKLCCNQNNQQAFEYLQQAVYLELQSFLSYRGRQNQKISTIQTLFQLTHFLIQSYHSPSLTSNQQSNTSSTSGLINGHKQNILHRLKNIINILRWIINDSQQHDNKQISNMRANNLFNLAIDRKSIEPSSNQNSNIEQTADTSYQSLYPIFVILFIKVVAECQNVITSVDIDENTKDNNKLLIGFVQELLTKQQSAKLSDLEIMFSNNANTTQIHLYYHSKLLDIITISTYLLHTNIFTKVSDKNSIIYTDLCNMIQIFQLCQLYQGVLSPVQLRNVSSNHRLLFCSNKSDSYYSTIKSHLLSEGITLQEQLQLFSFLTIVRRHILDNLRCQQQKRLQDEDGLVMIATERECLIQCIKLQVIGQICWQSIKQSYESKSEQNNEGTMCFLRCSQRIVMQMIKSSISPIIDKLSNQQQSSISNLNHPNNQHVKILEYLQNYLKIDKKQSTYYPLFDVTNIQKLMQILNVNDDLNGEVLLLAIGVYIQYLISKNNDSNQQLRQQFELTLLRCIISRVRAYTTNKGYIQHTINHNSFIDIDTLQLLQLWSVDHMLTGSITTGLNKNNQILVDILVLDDILQPINSWLSSFYLHQQSQNSKFKSIVEYMIHKILLSLSTFIQLNQTKIIIQLLNALRTSSTNIISVNVFKQIVRFMRLASSIVNEDALYRDQHEEDDSLTIIMKEVYHKVVKVLFITINSLLVDSQSLFGNPESQSKTERQIETITIFNKLILVGFLDYCQQQSLAKDNQIQIESTPKVITMDSVLLQMALSLIQSHNQLNKLIKIKILSRKGDDKVSQHRNQVLQIIGKVLVQQFGGVLYQWLRQVVDVNDCLNNMKQKKGNQSSSISAILTRFYDSLAKLMNNMQLEFNNTFNTHNPLITVELISNPHDRLLYLQQPQFTFSLSIEQSFTELTNTSMDDIDIIQSQLEQIADIVDKIESYYLQYSHKRQSKAITTTTNSKKSQFVDLIQSFYELVSQIVA